MTGEELRTIRHKLGLSGIQMGRAIYGRNAKSHTLDCQIRAFESGRRDIPPWIGKLVAMYGLFGIPEPLRDYEPLTRKLPGRPIVRRVVSPKG